MRGDLRWGREYQAPSDLRWGAICNERRRRWASYERHDCGFGLLCIGVWFALYWVWGLVCSVLGFGVCSALYWGLVCGFDFWFSDLLIALYWGFFFFFWRICGFATTVICWACCGLGSVSVTNFFFFQILVQIFFWVFFFFLLESRTNNFFFFLIWGCS